MTNIIGWTITTTENGKEKELPIIFQSLEEAEKAILSIGSKSKISRVQKNNRGRTERIVEIDRK